MNTKQRRRRRRRRRKKKKKESIGLCFLRSQQWQQQQQQQQQLYHQSHCQRAPFPAASASASAVSASASAASAAVYSWSISRIDDRYNIIVSNNKTFVGWRGGPGWLPLYYYPSSTRFTVTFSSPLGCRCVCAVYLEYHSPLKCQPTQPHQKLKKWKFKYNTAHPSSVSYPSGVVVTGW